MTLIATTPPFPVLSIFQPSRQYAPMDWAFAAISTTILPSGQITLADAGQRIPAALAQKLHDSLANSPAELLLSLATEHLHAAIPADLAFLRDQARDYLTTLCYLTAADCHEFPEIPLPSPEQFAFAAMKCPPLTGSEYVNAATLTLWWTQLDAHLRTLVRQTTGGVTAFLHLRNPAWRTVGRVTFHLAENKKDPDHPFAFMATYTHRLSTSGRPQHLPLARALQEYAGAGNRNALLKLLVPVDEAARKSDLVKSLLDSGEIYRAVAWPVARALSFLQQAAAMEEAGLVVRMPELWKSRRPARPMVSVKIGEHRKAGMNADTLLDFDLSVTLNGESLTPEELQGLLASDAGLVRIREQWVELDRQKLQAALDHWKTIQQHAAANGISFQEAIKMLAGANVDAQSDANDNQTSEWVGLSAGQWLEGALRRLRTPDLSAQSQHSALQGKLRTYQQSGVEWLRFVTQLGLGACLADDMGLGKTIQVITLLLHCKDQRPTLNRARASLLVAPASLLGNWQSEIARFAPTLRVLVLHGSEMPLQRQKDLAQSPASALEEIDLLITTYGTLTRAPWLTQHTWQLAILDEAQAIKNASTRQAQAACKIQAAARIAMTGTPVENRLSDLWSLFDFLNPGLLGSAKAFAIFTKSLQSQQSPNYRPLRSLIRPYILRRLKTDKSIIADLPEKTELKAWCMLSKPQVILYQQAVAELENTLQGTDGIQRRGLILATLLKLKQVCNHPSQWLGDGQYRHEDSGKFARLRELCEELSQRQQKVLVFSQFREIIPPLMELLQAVFGRPGLTLSGQTAVAQRRKLVEEFAREDGPPFFILSLKAGGTGLNLTSASTVIHFDRWWNPAVENQATDRAFRIGQKQNVLVHKFVCRGTVEEKIDALIEEKVGLSNELLDQDAQQKLTEMSNKELLGFLSLDLSKATEQ